MMSDDCGDDGDDDEHVNRSDFNFQIYDINTDRLKTNLYYECIRRTLRTGIHISAKALPKF